MHKEQSACAVIVMSLRSIARQATVLACILMACVSSASAQQKGQWVPGQFGLNAGVIPDPGITYANLVVNYSATRLNDSNGNPILPNVSGTFSFWADENIFYYVPNRKVLPTPTSSRSTWVGTLGIEWTSSPDIRSSLPRGDTHLERVTTWVPDIGETI